MSSLAFLVSRLGWENMAVFLFPAFPILQVLLFYSSYLKVWQFCHVLTT